MSRRQPKGGELPNRLLLIPLGVVLLCAVGAAVDWWSALPPGLSAGYVGRQSCVECHQQQFERWQGSDHDRAMALATPQTVLGDFNGREFTHNGVTSRMFREGDRFLVNTENARGEMETFEVKYTFGYDPLQQYMVEFPDGRVQVLTVAWDTHKQEWFHVLPDEPAPAGDWFHWTGQGFNWNFMCADCHSTNLQKNYDLASDRYHTSWSEINVSCEACHGPGSMHIELARSRSLFWDRRYGYGLAKLKGESSKNQLDACAHCHSHRRVVHDGFTAGDEYLDYYEPSLLDSDLYFADGQIKEEVYVYGSFLQSRMYREGVRCTDCHDPHSTKVRFEGNRLCTQCHVAGKYDGPAHHHHPVDSKGALCVECHMPERTYMQVDPRRDHSIRMPRPDLTVKLGVPNACQNCHARPHETAEWARDQVAAWYGPRRRPDPHYGEIFAAGRTGDPRAESALSSLARHRPGQDKATAVGPIVRATAVALLGRYGGTEAREAIRIALRDPEPLVRGAAVKHADAAREFAWLVPLLDDPIRSVRTEAARIISQGPLERLSIDQRRRFDAVLAEWREGQMATADDAGAHVALGAVCANLGQVSEAESCFLTAIRRRPNPLQAIQARVNLAMLKYQQGKKDEAEALFGEAVKLGPDLAGGDNAAADALLAGVYYNLGLLLGEDPQRLADAAQALGRAAELDPTSAAMHYNHGVALEAMGKLREAERALLAAVELEPQSAKYVQAMVRIYARLGDRQRTAEYIERFVALHPLEMQARARAEMAPAMELLQRPRPAGPRQ